MAKKRKTKRRKKPSVRWSDLHARRLFWRAGFGATADEVEKWTGRGRTATLDWLMVGDGAAKLVGAEPSADGKALDPENEYGHAQLWWMDRMVRSTRPLEEKMALLWHDHFSTNNSDPPLILRQNRMLRERGLGRFDELLREVTLDPAMQVFLSLAGSHKDDPNENYAREVMELFTIGSGYSEQDVREAARALTGFKLVLSSGRVTGVEFDPARHDAGPKTIFGKTGNWSWEDVLRLCLEHDAHAPFLVEKLWSFFIPSPILASTKAKLAKSYRDSGYRIAPLVRRILDHPHLYSNLDRPDMVKWPVVYVAGQLRQLGAPVNRRSWVYLTASMGQLLFQPPSVAGWDWGAAWMSSNAMRMRFVAANELLRKGGPIAVTAGSVDPGLSADAHYDLAHRTVGRPHVTRSSQLVLKRMIATFLAAPEASNKSEKVQRANAENLQRALRHLLVSGPDNQLC